MPSAGQILQERPRAGTALRVERRRFPYPYRALLAICSDLDETTDGTAYHELMRFLNTAGESALGPGAGLEVGNSIFFDMPPGQFKENAIVKGRT